MERECDTILRKIIKPKGRKPFEDIDWYPAILYKKYDRYEYTITGKDTWRDHYTLEIRENKAGFNINVVHETFTDLPTAFARAKEFSDDNS